MRSRAVAPLGIGAFAIGTDLFVVAGVLPDLAADLGVTVGTAGLTVTVFALAYATGAPVLGALLAARPMRQVLIGSLVLFALCNVVSALAPGLAVLLGARVLAALTASAYVPAAGAAAVAAAPANRRGRALGVVLGGSAVAMVLGAPLGALAASLLSWRAAFGLVAVLAVGTVVGLLRSGVGSDAPARSTLAERLRPLRSPAVAGTLAVTFLAMTASNSVYTYLAVLVSGRVELYIAAFGLAGVVGTWWGATAVDRFGSRRVVTAMVLVLGTGLATLPHVAGAVALAAVAPWGVAAWGFVSAQQHRVTGMGPAPLLLALNSSAVHLGFATGALLGGLVVDAAGVGSLWLVPLVCCGAGLVLHGILGREARS
ncbi:MFS transporter [Pseudonocardia cypriaca]|uniref:MFS transporter n=1 Tax=Pseudonocardia cypriaca TaxID=882449 RepID=UPI0014775B2E|nr:MFS transporter [Pseudonocardia cypriaca]